MQAVYILPVSMPFDVVIGLAGVVELLTTGGRVYSYAEGVDDLDVVVVPGF
jgi:hypothetical protein